MVKEGDREVLDAELVRRAQAGDRSALDALCARHVEGVFRVCRSVLGDDEQAADATQDCFIKAVVGLRSFRGDASFRTWILAIARNEARSTYRKRGRRGEQALETAAPVASEDADVADQAIVSDEARRARERIAELPEKQRLAVTLRVDEGLSFKEIGKIIGSSEGAARVNYHHGIRRLREMMA